MFEDQMFINRASIALNDDAVASLAVSWSIVSI
jgi:hypothetical protein